MRYVPKDLRYVGLPDYETFRVRIAAVQNFDSYKTTVFMVMECINGDKVVHTLSSTRLTDMHENKTDATLKRLRKAFKILQPLSKHNKMPSKSVEIVFGDLMPFLMMSRLVNPVYSYHVTTVKRTNIAARKAKKPIIFKYEPMLESISREKLIHSESVRKHEPSYEWTGVEEVKFWNEQKRIRRNGKRATGI